VPTRSGGSGDEATATLVDGGTNTITLGMTRKTMLIQSIEIKKVPAAGQPATAPSASPPTPIGTA
jgi:hypothetical protein